MVIGLEWIVIGAVIIALLVLGPKKIPALARGIGKAIGEFRRARREPLGEPNESDHP